MKKILMVGPVPPPYGGIASVVEDIVHSELSSEYSFEIFPRSAVFPYRARGLLGKNIFRLRRFLRFFKRLYSGSYNLVHIHSADPAFLGTTIFMTLARLAGVKVVLHMHGTDWNDFYQCASGFRKLLVRLGLLLPHRIIVLYSLWGDHIRELVGSAHVQVIGNFVRRQPPPDHSAVQRTREHLGLKKDHFVVLTVGSVGWRKGSFEILKALPLVVSQDDAVKFVLVGGEEKEGDMARLTAMVEEEKLADRVILTGEIDRENIPVFLSLADVFLLPSFIEGMPISIIEAMQWGLPVIATRVAAIPEMIEEGVSGVLINPGDAEQIAAAVLRLRQDESLRRRLGEAGERNFNDKYEFSKGIEKIRFLYDTI